MKTINHSCHKYFSKQLRKEFVHPISFVVSDNKNVFLEQNYRIHLSSFASIETLSEKQLAEVGTVKFGTVVNDEQFIFKCRYFASVKKEMKIEFNKQLYVIRRLINLQQKSRILVIIASMLTQTLP